MTLSDFEGVWQFDRVIVDAAGGGTSTATGTAVIEDGVYDEQAQLTLPDGTTLTGTRRYLWADTQGGIAVKFEDGRDFHILWFDAPKDSHWCDPDTYHVFYDLGDFPDWSSTWDVVGPRKSYRMTTRYRKQSD